MTKAIAVLLFIVALTLWAICLPFYSWVLFFWIVGTLIACGRKIPLGCVADVEILGVHVATWKSGYVPVIPFFPVPLFLNGYLMSITTRLAGTAVGEKTRIVNEENLHHLDDRLIKKKAVLQTGMLGMMSLSLFQDYFKTVINRNHPAHFVAVSLPIMFLFYLTWAWAVATGIPQVQLAKMPAPPVLDISMYTKKGEWSKLQYREIDGVRFAYHPENQSGSEETVHVRGESGVCFIILAGERLVIEQSTRPKYVRGVKRTVQYTPRDAYLPWYWRELDPPEEWKIKNLPVLLIKKRASWKYLHEYWEEVDPRYNLIVEAKGEKGSPGGGEACF